jgi:hypothetical protein
VDPAEWRRTIQEATTRRPDPIVAHTYRNRWQTASSPVLLACDDGEEYVVKGRQLGRVLINEQVIGRIGRALGAPVTDVALVDVPEALVQMEADMSHMPAGISHGNRWIPDCSERAWIQYTDEPQNRPRFALLAVLYGWVVPSDPQMIYENTAPHFVHSIDHAWFFPGGPNWTVDTLRAAPSPVPDATIVSECGLSNDELREAARRLSDVTDAAIAEAVAIPPEDWGISLDERVALAIYLAERRGKLASSLTGRS